MINNTLQEYVRLLITESVKNSVYARKTETEFEASKEPIRRLGYPGTIRMIQDANLPAIQLFLALDHFVNLEQKTKGYNNVDYNILGKETVERLIKHPNQDVRRNFSYHADQDILLRMIHDKASGVRVEVAKRLTKDNLPEMMNDTNKTVREIVSRNIDKKHLPKMMNDEHRGVRINVAHRIKSDYLRRMLDNEINGENYDVIIDIIKNRLRK